jgi:hypothetical protein
MYVAFEIDYDIVTTMKLVGLLNISDFNLMVQETFKQYLYNGDQT